MAKEKEMETWAKKASTSFKIRKPFFIHEPVTAFQPIWVEGKDFVKDFSQIPTHAHWVAAWWARAFTQVSAQGTCGQESVTISDVLVEFLNANKVAIQTTTRAGWEYDRHHWIDLSDRLRRNEPDIGLRKTFRTVDNNKVNDAATKVAEQVQLRAKPDNTNAAATPTAQSINNSRRQTTNPRGKVVRHGLV